MRAADTAACWAAAAAARVGDAGNDDISLTYTCIESRLHVDNG